MPLKTPIQLRRGPSGGMPLVRQPSKKFSFDLSTSVEHVFMDSALQVTLARVPGGRIELVGASSRITVSSLSSYAPNGLVPCLEHIAADRVKRHVGRIS
jgi:hypothetical protein